MRNVKDTKVGADFEPKTQLMDGYSRVVSANETLTIEDAGGVIELDTTLTVVTLPNTSEVPTGTKITVRFTDADIFTGAIAAGGTDTISGTTAGGVSIVGGASIGTAISAVGDFVELISGGAGVWYIGATSGGAFT